MKSWRIWLATPIIGMFLCAWSSAWPIPKALVNPPATQPSTPIQNSRATDQPLDLRGADGQTADWLKAFDVRKGNFDYTLQLVDQDDFITAYRVTYASPFAGPFAEMNVVPAELYLPRQAQGKMRSAIVLDIMAGNAIVARAMARGLAEGNVAALYVPMANARQRRPKADPNFRIGNLEPQRAVDALRQTVMDIRRAKAILSSRADIDSSHIGIVGISLGGIVASLAAGVDGTFDRVVPILAGGNIAELVFVAPETRKLSRELAARGITAQDLGKILAPVEPTHFAMRIDPRRCLMINAASDEVIPKPATLSLNQSIGSPLLLWAPCGHYSSVLFLPAIRQTAIRFLAGQEVDKIKY